MDRNSRQRAVRGGWRTGKHACSTRPGWRGRETATRLRCWHELQGGQELIKGSEPANRATIAKWMTTSTARAAKTGLRSIEDDFSRR